MPAYQAEEVFQYSPTCTIKYYEDYNMLKIFLSQSIFKDSQAVILMVASFLLLMVHNADFALNIRSQEIRVPIRYSGYDESLSDKGSWAALLVLVVFGIAVFAINMAISIKVYRLRRSLAIAVLIFNIVVLLFLLFVSRALLNLV